MTLPAKSVETSLDAADKSVCATKALRHGDTEPRGDRETQR